METVDPLWRPLTGASRKKKKKKKNYIHERLVDGNITGVDSTYIGRFYLRFHYKETEWPPVPTSDRI